MSHRRNSGFTLVELLVVIAIIGMLMALLLPAVNGARQTARQARCKNRISQLAKAAIGYETTNSRLPGYANKVGPNGEIRGSWPMMLLNGIERSDVFAIFKDGTYPNPVPVIDIFMCPSDPPQIAGEPQISFVANAGRADRPETDSAGRSEGVFLNQYDSGLYTNIDYLSNADGTSTTLMLAENVNATQWQYPSSKTLPASANPMHPFNSNGNAAGPANIFVWFNTARPRPMQRINGEIETVSTLTLDAARPSSYHPGGVNVAFCDTHVAFLRESIDYRVYVQLMTPNGRELQGANAALRSYLLNDSDY